MFGLFASIIEAKAINQFLKQCLECLDNNDTGSLNMHLSAALQISDCQDAFEEFGASLPPRVAKCAEKLSRQVSNCLAVSEQT